MNYRTLCMYFILLWRVARTPHKSCMPIFVRVYYACITCRSFTIIISACRSVIDPHNIPQNTLHPLANEKLVWDYVCVWYAATFHDTYEHILHDMIHSLHLDCKCLKWSMALASSTSKKKLCRLSTSVEVRSAWLPWQFKRFVYTPSKL